MLRLARATTADGQDRSVMKPQLSLVERAHEGEVDEVATMAARKAGWKLSFEVIEPCICLNVTVAAVNGRLMQAALQVADRRYVDELLLVPGLDTEHGRLATVEVRMSLSECVA